MSGSTETNINLNFGALKSINSFQFQLVNSGLSIKKLKRLGERDLHIHFKDISAGKIDFGALTFLLSILERIKDETSLLCQLNLSKNQEVLQFLKQSGFLDICRKNKLITDNSFENNYEKKPPSFKTICFLDYSRDRIGHITNQESYIDRQDDLRWILRNDFIQETREIVFPRRTYNKNAPTFTESEYIDIADVVAELILNGLYWGDSKVYVGVQRSKYGFNFCIIDSGIGFKNTLDQLRSDNLEYHYPSEEIDGIIIGSLLKRDDFYGLSRVIEITTKKSGSVSIWSNNGEHKWTRSNWIEAGKYELTQINLIRDKLFKMYTANPPKRWPVGIRGVRISIEVPFSK